MKNALIACLFVCLFVPVSFAMANNIGLSLDAKTANYTSSFSSLSATNNLDPMFGIGLAIRVPLRSTLSLLFEGQYNTATSFTNSLGVKYDLSVYPLQISLQNNVGGLYFGGGINYALWTLSGGGNSFSENNGIGYQVYAGLDGLLLGNLGLELKYTSMTASVSAFGSAINQVANTISLGTKIWIN